MLTGQFLTIERVHSRALFQTAYNLTRNTHDAEDVVQETFLRAFRSFSSRRKEQSLFAWLRRIATNVAYDKLRSRKEFVSDEEAEFDDLTDGKQTPEQRLIMQEKADRLECALRNLSPTLRDPFLLREIEGLSYQQIATRLQIPIGTVMSRLARAKDTLREQVKTPIALRAILME